MGRKPKQNRTLTDRERIELLEKRLDAACSEHRRMRDELRALEARDPLDDLRAALRRQDRRRETNPMRPPLDGDVSSDDTVN